VEMVVRRLWGPEEVVRHLLGLEEEAVVSGDRVVRPFLDEEGEKRQKPGRK
jgi:hypothetical protein